MIDIGRLCVKIAGRDAGKTCVVVDLLDERHVLIDGQTRRRKCNISHLEPLNDELDIKKGASHDIVVKVFSAKGLVAVTPKSKKAVARPRALRGTASSPSAKKEKPAKAKVEKPVVEATQAQSPKPAPQKTPVMNKI